MSSPYSSERGIESTLHLMTGMESDAARLQSKVEFRPGDVGLVRLCG